MFKPVAGETMRQAGRQKAIEKAFFQSLENLCSLYRLPAPVSESGFYPANILTCYEYMKDLLKKHCPDLHLIIIQDADTCCSLATVKVFNTGTFLYFIPVAPLYRLLQDGQRHTANLLLSLYAHLYRLIGVPYFTEGEGYLAGEYEMMQQWYEDDPSACDEEYYIALIAEFKLLNYAGSKLLKSIRHPYHLSQFANRLNNYKAILPEEKTLLDVCTQFFSLSRKYPEQNLFGNIANGLLYPQEEDRIMVEQYISFIWSAQGQVYEQLIQSLNTNFQEMGVIEEPLSIQLFNSPQGQQTHDLDFATELFRLLTELSDALIFYDE